MKQISKTQLKKALEILAEAAGRGARVCPTTDWSLCASQPSCAICLRDWALSEAKK